MRGSRDLVSRTHISFRPFLYFLSFSVLPYAFSRLPSRFPRSLLYSFASFCVPLFPLPLHPFLSLRVFFLHPSSHLSCRVFLRCSQAPSASHCETVFLALQLLSSVLGVPSVLEPDGPIVPCSRLTGLLMTHRIEREVDPCCYAATAMRRSARGAKEKECGGRAETNGRRATAMIIRGPNNQCGPPTKRTCASSLLLNHVFF